MKSEEFKRVQREGQKKSGNVIFTTARSRARRRLGITVSKKYGKAHDRVVFKRTVREAFRQCQHLLKEDVEIVVSPRKPHPTQAEVLHDLMTLYAKC